MNNLTIGLISPVLANLVVMPLDNANTFLKTNSKLSTNGAASLNLIDACKHIFKSNGIGGLWRGAGSMSLLQLTMNGVRFGAFQPAHNFWQRVFNPLNDGERKNLINMLAGGSSGAVGGFISQPFNFLKIKRQSSSNAVQLNDFRISSLSKGIFINTFRCGMAGMTQFATYFWVLNKLKSSETDSSSQLLMNRAISGSIAGIALALVANPFDVLVYNIYLTNQRETTSLKIFQNLIRKEGFSIFYKGLLASSSRLASASLLTLVIWEELRDLFLIK